MRQFTTEQIKKIIDRYLAGHKMTRKNNIFYRNLEGTLDANIVVTMNFEEKLEYSKCHSNIFYFIEKYCHFDINNIKLRSFQKEWIDNFINNRFNIYCVSRQTGYSNIMAAIYLHYLIFNVGKNILTLSNKGDTSTEFLKRIYTLYKNLPYFLKPGIESKNLKTLKFNNKNTIKCLAASKEIGVGDDVHILQYLDFASINPSILYTNYRALIPTMVANKDTKIIIQSQPNGTNFFYKLVNDSERKMGDPLKNMYKTTKTYWWEVEGRDNAWKEQEIKNIGGEDAFNQEYDLQFVLHPYKK